MESNERESKMRASSRQPTTHGQMDDAYQPIRARFADAIERFHSRGQQPCKFIVTKDSFYIRKEFNSHRIGLGHQHGRRFIVLGHQYGCRDVM